MVSRGSIPSSLHLIWDDAFVEATLRHYGLEGPPELATAGHDLAAHYEKLLSGVPLVSEDCFMADSVDVKACVVAWLEDTQRTSCMDVISEALPTHGELCGEYFDEMRYHVDVALLRGASYLGMALNWALAQCPLDSSVVLPTEAEPSFGKSTDSLSAPRPGKIKRISPPLQSRPKKRPSPPLRKSSPHMRALAESASSSDKDVPPLELPSAIPTVEITPASLAQSPPGETSSSVAVPSTPGEAPLPMRSHGSPATKTTRKDGP